MIPIIGPLFSLLTTGVEKYVEYKKTKVEGKIAQQQAINKRLENLDKADADWDQIMAQGSQVSWKDEWFTILLSIPAILAFIPGAVGYVEQGFKALNGMPDWYKAAFGLAVAASFGYRKFIGVMNNKNK